MAYILELVINEQDNHTRKKLVASSLPKTSSSQKHFELFAYILNRSTNSICTTSTHVYLSEILVKTLSAKDEFEKQPAIKEINAN